MPTKVKEHHRAWLGPKDEDDYVRTEAEEWPGYRNDSSSRYIDLDLILHDGSSTTRFYFNHTRGDASTIKRARAKLNKLQDALDRIDWHIRDAEDHVDEDREARKADKVDTKSEEWL